MSIFSLSSIVAICGVVNAQQLKREINTDIDTDIEQTKLERGETEVTVQMTGGCRYAENIYFLNSGAKAVKTEKRERSKREVGTEWNMSPSLEWERERVTLQMRSTGYL